MTDVVWASFLSLTPPYIYIARVLPTGVLDPSTPSFTNASLVNDGQLGAVQNGGQATVWAANSSTDVLRFANNDSLIGDISDPTIFSSPGQPFQQVTGEVWVGSQNNVSPLANILRFNADGTPYAGGHLVIDGNLDALACALGPEGAVWVTNTNFMGDYIYRLTTAGALYGGGGINPAGRTVGQAYALCAVGLLMWASGYNGSANCIDLLDGTGAITSSIVLAAGEYCTALSVVGMEVWAALNTSTVPYLARYDTSGTLLGTVTLPLAAYDVQGLCVTTYVSPGKPVGWFFTPVRKIAGYALCIDAVAATGQITAATDLPFGSGDFTIGGWVRTTRDNISPTTVCAVGMASPYDTYLLLEVSPAGPGNTYVAVVVAQAGTFYVLDTGGSAPLGPAVGAHLLVVTRAGTTLTLYVDGASWTTTIGAGSINQSGGQTYFSAPPGPGIPVAPGGYNWDGYMWYWGAWVGTAVSGTDIAAWYAGGTSAPLPGTPTHQWLMNEGYGLILHDTVGSDDVSSPSGFTWAPRP